MISDIFMIPTAYSFSELEWGEESYDMPGHQDIVDDMLLENTILNMLKFLPSDRERLVLLLQIMRGDGYQFNNKDIATLFKIEYSWYMRILRGIKRKLIPFAQKNDEKILKAIKNFENCEEKLKKRR